MRFWIIIGAGIAIRLLLLLIVDPRVDLFAGDAGYYASGRLDGFRPPLYVLFLKLTLPLGWWFPLVVQSAMTIGSGVAIGRRNFLAGLLIAGCPFLALFDFRLLSESLYINLLIWAWLAPLPIASGVLLGLAILTRDTLLLLPLLAVAILRTRYAAVTALVAYACVLPWYVTGSSQSRFGLNLWAGTWERNGDWYLRDLYNAPEFPPYAFRSPGEERLIRSTWPNDDVLKRVAFDRIKSDTVGTAKVWASRYWRLWVGTRSDNIAFRAERFSLTWKALKSAFWGLNLLTLLFGLWGLLKPDKFAIPVLYAALVYIPFHNTETRYSLFAIPFLLWLGCRRLRNLRIANARRKSSAGEIDRASAVVL